MSEASASQTNGGKSQLHNVPPSPILHHKVHRSSQLGVVVCRSDAEPGSENVSPLQELQPSSWMSAAEQKTLHTLLRSWTIPDGAIGLQWHFAAPKPFVQSVGQIAVCSSLLSSIFFDSSVGVCWWRQENPQVGPPYPSPQRWPPSCCL